MANSDHEIQEGEYGNDFWDRLDIHVASYLKSPFQLYCASAKTTFIGRMLRHGIIDLFDYIKKDADEYIENETISMGNESRLYHSRVYSMDEYEDTMEENASEDSVDRTLSYQVSSIAPTIFYKLREDIGISNVQFRESFTEDHLKDFTNPGRSGSLMYKTSDDLFILKTLRDYEARLLVQILSGYHFQLIQRSTLLSRYIGLYRIRFQGTLTTIDLFFAVMANAFTFPLTIHEIFDLKGATMNRQLVGDWTPQNFLKLKDLDFRNLYPFGIRIPTAIYKKLKRVITNDTRALKKLNVTDYSLIIGIRHLNMTPTQMMQRRPMKVAASLFYVGDTIGSTIEQYFMATPSSATANTRQTPYCYLKPLQMLHENVDMNLYYNDDTIAHSTLPIPGIINETNKCVYIYLAIIDILQTYDNIKFLDRAFRKIAYPNRHHEYSIVKPINYETRINRFLFENVFVDAQDDFPWTPRSIRTPVVNIDTDNIGSHLTEQQFSFDHTQAHSNESQDSASVIEIRL